MSGLGVRSAPALKRPKTSQRKKRRCSVGDIHSMRNTRRASLFPQSTISGTASTIPSRKNSRHLSVFNTNRLILSNRRKTDTFSEAAVLVAITEIALVPISNVPVTRENLTFLFGNAGHFSQHQDKKTKHKAACRAYHALRRFILVRTLISV